MFHGRWLHTPDADDRGIDIDICTTVLRNKSGRYAPMSMAAAPAADDHDTYISISARCISMYAYVRVINTYNNKCVNCHLLVWPNG